jgi:hypothetical protein
MDGEARIAKSLPENSVAMETCGLHLKAFPIRVFKEIQEYDLRTAEVEAIDDMKHSSSSGHF